VPLQLIGFAHDLHLVGHCLFPRSFACWSGQTRHVHILPADLRKEYDSVEFV
jgi:hypothetical protein